MQKRAAEVLFATAALYGLASLLAQGLFPSSAQGPARAVVGALVLAGLLGVMRHAGLWAYGGLAWPPGTLRRLARKAAPFAPILVIPLLNVACAGGIPSRPAFVLAAVLCGATLEELLLRGLTLPLLISFAPKHVPAAVIACAALFAGLHIPQALMASTPYALTQVAVAFFLGAALGFMRVCTGSVYPGIVAHILINATAAGPILYGGQQLWLAGAAAAAVGTWSYLWWRKLRPAT